jgi:hypothetical protein
VSEPAGQQQRDDVGRACVAVCGWDDERVESLGSALGDSVLVRRVRIPEAAPVSERFAFAFAQALEIVQDAIRSLSRNTGLVVVQVIVPERALLSARDLRVAADRKQGALAVAGTADRNIS